MTALKAEKLQVAPEPAEYPNLTAALAAIQPLFPVVGKAETATVPTKAGGQYKYSYADLAAVASAAYPLLGQVGLAFVTKPTRTDHGYVLVGKLRHISGEFEEAEFPLPENPPQAVGSAITYGRRYLLGALTGIVTGEDDDGAAAQQAATTRPVENAEPYEQAINAASTKDELQHAGQELAGSNVSAADRDRLRSLYRVRAAEITAAAEIAVVEHQQTAEQHNEWTGEANEVDA